MNLIASLVHTCKHHEHIIFWSADWKGYTPVAGNAGRYDDEVALRRLNDGLVSIAVPEAVVMALSVPTPMSYAGRQFYNVAGPVIDNTRANWDALIAGSLLGGRREGVKPKVGRDQLFRGRRNAIPAPRLAMVATTETVA